MNRSLESIRTGLKFESLISEKIMNFSEGQEYADDDSLKKSPWEVFWALSSARRYTFLFYPFKKEASCLVLNDCFASVAGILCEKSQKVDFYAASENLDVAKKRLNSRKNIEFYPFSALDADAGKYDYAFINLEYNESFLRRYIVVAAEKIKDSGTIFFSLNKDLYQQVADVLYDKQIYFRSYDLFDNGMILIEAVKDAAYFVNESLFDWSEYKKRNGCCSSPLLYSKWIRNNDIPFFNDSFFSDQDFDVICSVKPVLLDLLKKLVSVCKTNGLKLYPMYGTLLGSIRNEGLIAGDDDIDVALMRPDYDKLMSLAGQFSGKYFLQTFENDDCFYGGYAKLRNAETTAIHPQNWWSNCCEGIGIDIFPIDNVCSSKSGEAFKLREIRFYQRMMYAYSYGFFRDFMDMKLLRWKAYKYLGKIISRKTIISKFQKAISKGDSQERLAIYTHYGNGSMKTAAYFDSADFNSSFQSKYDGISVEIPSGWNNILKSLYGDEYNEPPLFNEFKMRHGFYDTKKSYPVWKERFGGLKHPASIKEPVVLFGDGSLFKACLKYYKSRVNITHLVLLPGEEKECRSIMEIPVVSFEEFETLDIDRNSYRGIICSGDALLADAVLSEKGYSGLYIFWQDRNWMMFANQTAIWKCIKSLRKQYEEDK